MKDYKPQIVSNGSGTPDEYKGAVRLIEAIYWQAIKDIVSEWRFADKHGEHKWSHDYQSAVAFLKQSGKGQRILRMLKNLDDEQRARLINFGLTIDTGIDYNKEV